MAKRLLAVLIALVVTFTGAAGLVLNQEVQKADALYSCVMSPTATGTGAHYAGSFCYSGAIGGKFHYSVARCQYRLYVVYHTYTVTGPYASDGQWSWVTCGTHFHDMGTCLTCQTYDQTVGYFDKVISLQVNWSP